MKMKIVCIGSILFCLLSGVAYGGEEQDRSLQELQDYLHANGLPAATQLISNQMARSMPMQIDSFTRLHKVNYSFPETIVVFVTVLLTKQQIEGVSSLADISENMTRDTITRACSEPVIETMIGAGMKLVYRYQDAENRFLFAVSTENADCRTIASLDRPPL